MNFRDTIGHARQAIPAMNTSPATTHSLIELCKAILERLGQTPADSDDSLLTSVGQKDATATNDNMSDIATTDLSAKVRLILNRMSANAFTSTINGSARTELDVALAQIAAYFATSGAAIASTVDPGGSSRATLELILEDIAKVIVGGGPTTFPTAAAPANSISMAAVIRDTWDALRNGTGGTEPGTNKSVIDAIGSDGTNMISGDYSMGSIHQFLHGLHGVAHILFIVPEAGSVGTDNVVLQTELAKLGEVVTITQADLLAHAELASYTLCVLGTSIGGTAWTTTNLADIKITPDLPLLCVDKVVAEYFEIGTDGGDAAAKTDINAVGTIKGSLLGVGEYGITGLSVGANTVTASATYHTLTMVDGDLTETWYAYETDNANTDVVIGGVYRINNDGSVGIDETGAQVAASMLFCGFAYDASELTTLGKGIIRLAALILIYERTAGLAVTLSGDIGDLETKMIGNMKTKFSNGTPLAKFIAGTSASLGTVQPAGVSLYDVLGIFSGDGGAAQNDSAKASLDLIHTALSGSTAAVNRASGNLQMAATTIDLNQAAGTDTLFTGTTQSVVLEKLTFRMPNVDISGGALTSISIQTDDAEPAVLISTEDGALVFLEEEASLSWTGALEIPTGTLIQFTIAGGAAGVTSVCSIVAQCRAVVNLGYLN